MPRTEAILAAALALALAERAAADPYVIRNIGHLGGGFSYPFAIDPQGRVAGYSASSDSNNFHAFLFDGAAPPADLAPFGLASQAVAFAFDGQGRPVGFGYSFGDLGATAYRWSPGSAAPTPLAHFAARGASRAPGGHIVGSISVASARQQVDHACVYVGGTLTDLGTLIAPPAFSSAVDVSDAGWIVGSSQAAGQGAPQHACLWTAAGSAPIDLGTLPGGSASQARCINESRQVVGVSDTAAQPAVRARACLWNLDPAGNVLSRVNLGTLGASAALSSSYAWSINSRGSVVGTSDARAFLWTPEPPGGATGTMIDLNSLLPANSGWVLEVASAIDDAGRIVGWGTFGGNPAGFLLIPCAADFNRSGAVTVQDIYDFLEVWLAGAAAADFNHSGDVTVQDIYDYLEAWSAGCA